MSFGELPTYDYTDQGIRLLEEERRRIARDLHDGPTQTLTNVSMRLELLDRMLDTNPTVAKRELTRINSQVVQSINAIRRLLFDLRPIAVDEVGLVRATQELIDKYRREVGSPIDLEVKQDIGQHLSPAKQVAIYRLVQEILNNTLKHAQASRIEISIEQIDQTGQISIRDDGKGFDPTHIPVGHYGIIGMKERAAFLNGQLNISSEIGVGSVFILTIPLSAAHMGEIVE